MTADRGLKVLTCITVSMLMVQTPNMTILSPLCHSKLEFSFFLVWGSKQALFPDDFKYMKKKKLVLGKAYSIFVGNSKCFT